MRKLKEEPYIFVNGHKVFVKELKYKDPVLLDMIYEGSFGDPDKVINDHTRLDSRTCSF